MTVIVALIPNIMMMINVVSIVTNLSIPGVDQDAEQVEFLVREERTKRKSNTIIYGPIISLDTSLDETNYDAFDSLILEECLESNIDKISYKWTASTVSSGRCNGPNIMPLRPRPQKRVRNKNKPTVTWTNFFTDDMITTVLNKTNKKIMVLIEQMPEEVRSNDKYTYLREVKKKRASCLFWYLICKGLAWTKFSKIETTF